MAEIRIEEDDPRVEDVRELLERHVELTNAHSPPEDVHALDVEGLLASDVAFFSCRRDGELLAVGALKQLAGRHAELKSMHTAPAARGRGIGRAVVEHLVGIARERGSERVSLETGSTAAFAPARSLYASAGFGPCGPFGDYRPSVNSTFMTLVLDQPAGSGLEGSPGELQRGQQAASRNRCSPGRAEVRWPNPGRWDRTNRLSRRALEERAFPRSGRHAASLRAGRRQERAWRIAGLVGFGSGKPEE